MAGDLLKGEHQDLNLRASKLIAAFKSNKNSFNCSKSGFAFCWQFQIREKMTVLSSSQHYKPGTDNSQRGADVRSKFAEFSIFINMARKRPGDAMY